MVTESAGDSWSMTGMETVAFNYISSSCSPHTEMIFYSLSDPDQTTAVTVSCGGSGYSFSTHKLLLAAASPFLRKLLAETQSEPSSILLPDTSCSTLRLLEQFLEAGEIRCQSKQDHASCHQLLDSLQLLPDFNKLRTRSALIKPESDQHLAGESEMHDDLINDNIDSGLALTNGVMEKTSKSLTDVPKDTIIQNNNIINNKILVQRKEKCEKVTCPYCQKTFNRSTNFDIHVRRHEENRKQYVCEVCDYEFSTKHSYFKHKKTHVIESQKTVCDVCGGNYKDAHTLKVHLETQHLMMEKPFTCEVCGDKFKTRGSLKIHSSKHEEERAFVCDECGFQTKNKWLLKAHIKTHKTVKDFQCTHCPKTFNFQFILDKHIRIHTNERPFSCETCGTSFVSGIHLRRHQKSVHKPVRDFVCNICSAPFKRLSELKRHIILHTSEKPFECKVCGETFKHREAGRRHSKASHPGSTSSITFKPTETIGKLNTFAIKKLSPEEVANAGQSSIHSIKQSS